MLINVSTFKANIHWILNVTKYSMNSSTDSEKLFRSMFPDNAVAKSFQCGPTKAGYVATFGLAIYFQNILLQHCALSPITLFHLMNL